MVETRWIELAFNLDPQDAANRLKALTPRERQVCNLMVCGKTSKQIAEKLGISPKTLDIHRARVMTKLGTCQSGLGRVYYAAVLFQTTVDELQGVAQ